MADKKTEEKSNGWWDKFMEVVDKGSSIYTSTLNAKSDQIAVDKLSEYIADQNAKKEAAGYITFGDYSVKITDIFVLIGGTLGLLLAAKLAKSVIK